MLQQPPRRAEAWREARATDATRERKDQTNALRLLVVSVGSALLSWHTFLPALVVAAATFGMAWPSTFNTWLQQHLLEASAFFNSLTFVVALALQSRMNQALERWRTAHAAYVLMGQKLFDLAMLLSAWLQPEDVPANATPEDATAAKQRNADREALRLTCLRWIRAMHVTAIEDLQGHHFKHRRVTMLSLEEEQALVREHKRLTRLLCWLCATVTTHRGLFRVGDPSFAGIFSLVQAVTAEYSTARRIAETPYPINLAQLSVVASVLYAILCPFFWGAFFPGSYVLGPAVAFAVMWLMFGSVQASVGLEIPFDDVANSVPLAHHALELQDDVSFVEFSMPQAPKVEMLSVLAVERDLRARERGPEREGQGPEEGDGNAGPLGPALVNLKPVHNRDTVAREARVHIQRYLRERKILRSRGRVRRASAWLAEGMGTGKTPPKEGATLAPPPGAPPPPPPTQRGTGRCCSPLGCLCGPCDEEAPAPSAAGGGGGDGAAPTTTTFIPGAQGDLLEDPASRSPPMTRQPSSHYDAEFPHLESNPAELRVRGDVFRIR